MSSCLCGSNFYHPKGEGNGYVLTYTGRRTYIAGDTEASPEMKALEGTGIQVRIRDWYY